MKFTTTLAVAFGLAASVNAHTRVFGVYVNDVFQGDGQNKYIRSPPTNSPFKDVSLPAISCNVNNVAVSSKVTASAGDKVTFEWFHDTRGDDILDPSHKGPITVYIAPLSSNGNGAVWSKLAESGLVNGVWATDAMIANGGKHSIVLPASLKGGDYLLRAEVIALHEGDTNFAVNPARGAQFYPSCSQFTITGTGSAVPNQNFNFVGGYTPAGAGILFNVYGGATVYPIPGPAVWVPSGSGTVAPTAPKPTTTTTTPTKPTTTSYKPTPTTLATVTRPRTTAKSTTTAKPAAPATSCVPKWGQCGGVNFSAPGPCEAGTTCKFQNPYYSQCL